MFFSSVVVYAMSNTLTSLHGESSVPTVTTSLEEAPYPFGSPPKEVYIADKN